MSAFDVFDFDEVTLLLEASKNGKHKTMAGTMVSVGSNECREDILRRIDDTAYHRNDNSYGSDARAYLSGVLRVLRRKLKENDRMASTERAETKDKKPPEELLKSGKKLTNESVADRMMKLAGLID